MHNSSHSILQSIYQLKYDNHKKCTSYDIKVDQQGGITTLIMKERFPRGVYLKPCDIIKIEQEHTTTLAFVISVTQDQKLIVKTA
jgi:hypothetical protein